MLTILPADNNIGSVGATAIADALKFNSTIEEIDISCMEGQISFAVQGAWICHQVCDVDSANHTPSKIKSLHH